MDLSCDTSLKIKFEALSLPKFWIYMKMNTWNSQNYPPKCYCSLIWYICLKKKFTEMAAMKS